MSRSRGEKIFSKINMVFLTVVSLICFLPFVNLLAVSFSGSTAVAAGKVVFWPVDFTLQSYEFAFFGGRFVRALGVSAYRVLLGVIVNMLLIVCTAYPLSKTKEKLRGRNIYMIYFILTMFISGGLIPLYLVVVNLGLIDSIWALVLPGALPIFNMVIFMNFMRGLPHEIEEAALIDGAGPITVLTRVILPLLKPALATIGLFCVVAHWNDWFSGIIFMNRPDNYPLQSYLQTLLQNIEAILRQSTGNYAELLNRVNARTGRAAQLFLGMIPILAIYPFLQKYFTSGLVLGSVKG